MGFLSAAGTVLAEAAKAVAPAAGQIIGSWINAKQADTANKRNVDMTEDVNAKNIAMQKEINQQNIDFQREINAQNMAFQREQFDEQRYLNRNQYQITASDMQNAGLNPMLINGANLSSGSYQSTSQAAKAEAAKAEAATVNPYQLDTASLSNALTEMNKIKAQKDIARDQNRTQKEIAKERNDTDKYIADLQATTQTSLASKHIEQQDREFQAKLAQDWSIAQIEAKLKDKGLSQEKAIEDAKRISEQLQRDDDYQKAMEQIRLENERIKNAHSEKEKELAIQSRNGWLNFASSIFNTVVSSASRVGTALINKSNKK